ncbi:CBS domain-containing protein [Candidatus Woesearchaeota archaeon]|nr:CBS domain-containing protein [Candidatus Woesearchaeota archaeon]
MRELSEIKKIRKSLGLSQTELAKRANVSQSLIAKVESGKIDPTFTKTKKIFEALSYLQNKEETKVAEFMSKKIISVSSDNDIMESIEKMKKFEISQMPVIEEHKVIGLVSESTLLEALINKKGKKVSDIMEDSPPTVSKTASINVVSDLLRHYPMVMVSDNGKLVGLATKSDLLSKLYKG